MNVVVGPGVRELVGERGGRLFVWLERPRCCGGGATYLSTGDERPAEPHRFRRTYVDGFELSFDGGRLIPRSCTWSCGVAGERASRRTGTGACSRAEPQALMRSPFGSYNGSP